ncbi:pyrimidine 5'-nucleotidase [Burkholderia ubonensis]|uniref:pyrimidine 5'-nucleotidase n=1 Tax=Burkholderia ubonensis TaxID=101571 RepID=UPI0007551CC2|nr:pyrimidine 5'-nucleotidase [Burkholderia ubonensis]KVS36746.1 HAD family hydrolase [Burkholderia ubonensis]KVS47595.1 HAD family hydrolase [Burkholderia ubonensis]KVS70906.1 HAD family hydrolase [Burkholderia ubonensis]KVS83138.1 HAD family hydrolase [Burkholderia ubonensis]KVS93046.1 HAD family hydrolase [Burkholderia ubonensis]
MSARRHQPSSPDLPAALRRRRISRSRPRAGAPVWLFDLDNTLHHASHAIFPEINRAMTQYIADALQVGHAEADRLRNDYTVRYGAALLGLTRHHRIDPHDFLRVVHTFADLPAMLHAERGLARIVAALPGRKFVLTNAPENYARAVLRELRIERLFERVIAIEHMRDRRAWRAKPDYTMLRRTLRAAHARPTDAILVEDTRSHLKRYKRFGIGTVWITGHLPGRLPGTGRPHYVDQRIRSLKSLRLGTRSGRQKCSRLTRRAKR